MRGAVRLRDAIPRGTVFLADGTEQDAANLLTEPVVEIARVGGPGERHAAPGRRPSGAAEMLPVRAAAIPPTGPSQSGHDA